MISYYTQDIVDIDLVADTKGQASTKESSVQCVYEGKSLGT